MASFETAVHKLLAVEGGKVEDPKDPGGRTNFGITQKSLSDFKRRWPNSMLPEDVFNLTKEQAIFFYRAEYWGGWGNKVESQKVADVLLSVMVLQGKGTAVKRIQGILGVAQDGAIGPQTIEAINRADGDGLARVFAKLTRQELRDLVVERPALAKFSKGWENRMGHYA